MAGSPPTPPVPIPLPERLQRDVARFLAEDLGMDEEAAAGASVAELLARDVTCAAVARGERVEAVMVVQEEAVVAGLTEAAALFARPGARATATVADGARVASGTQVLAVEGPAAAVLAAERAALNLLMRMSGVATGTRRAVDLVRAVNPGCEVAATRKTTPGLRAYEKRAVLLGGGATHRMGLWDAVLVKDNHLLLAGSVAEAVRRCRDALPEGTPIEVECDTEAQAAEAAALGVEWILLDNWSPARLAQAVPGLREAHPGLKLEASGGITPEAVTAYAPWVDRVSMGGLTHSARAVPCSLELTVVQR